ncbi:MAG: ATP-binding protein [Bdellovibrionota bacterium]
MIVSLIQPQLLQLCFFALVIFGAIQLSFRRDCRRFLRELGNLLSGEQSGSSNRIRNPDFQCALRFVRNLIHESKRSFHEPDTTLSIGKRMTSVSDEAAAAARTVSELLLQRFSGRLKVVAIGQWSNREGLRIEHLNGLPEGRSAEMLLSELDTWIDTGPDAWKWSRSRVGVVADLSIFDVRAALCIPLTYGNSRSGLFWLGFRDRTAELTDEEARFVNSLAEYCAGSFVAASRVRERIAEQNRQRDFLIGISHDLRAPGNSALYSLRDLLSDADGNLNQAQRRKLRVIESCLVDQLDVLSDILDYTKHQKGMLEPSIRAISLCPFVRHLVEDFQSAGRDGNLRITTVDLPEVSVLCDARHLRRILANLISNALKYTEEGVVSVSATLSDHLVTLNVTDSGSGIPPEERHLLFREFSRLSNSAGKQGTGLGLVIAKALADLNQASLSYAPNVSGGSTFALALPRAETEISRRPGPVVSRILIVDDDPATCRMLARYLSPLALVVDSAESVHAAVRAVTKAAYDAVITDYRLGEHSAEPLLNLLRQRFPATPTLLLSGSTAGIGPNPFGSGDRIRVLEKPVDRETLQDAVREITRVAVPFHLGNRS